MCKQFFIVSVIVDYVIFDFILAWFKLIFLFCSYTVFLLFNEFPFRCQYFYYPYASLNPLLPTTRQHVKLVHYDIEFLFVHLGYWIFFDSSLTVP